MPRRGHLAPVSRRKTIVRSGIRADAAAVVGAGNANDARFLWIAVANAGGVYAYDKPTVDISLLRKGNVFALAVDDDGVYWGDHDGTGTLRMLVK